VLNKLRDQDAEHLDKCLARATSGSPRLLLYTFRALHFLQAPLGTPHEIETAVFQTVYTSLRQIPVVAREFFPGRRDSAHTAFAYLLAFHLSAVSLEVNTVVHFRGKDHSLAQLLRFQPFFLSRDHGRESRFTLQLPLFHLKAAQELFGVEGVPMLLIAMAGVPWAVTDPWRVFERLPAQIIAVKAALDRALGRCTSGMTWAQALPVLFSNSKIAKTIQFDLGQNPFLLSKVTEKLPKAIEDAPEKFVQRGGGFTGEDKSSSEDLLYPQRLVNGGYAVVGWQQKLLVATTLQMSIARDEVAKGTKKLPALQILLAATVGSQLLKAVNATKERVLVLPSWDQEQPAEFAFGSSTTGVKHVKSTPLENETSTALLWRPHRHGQENESWCVFPAQKALKAVTPFRGAYVVVRPGLEVVIPHHEVVRNLLGARTFDALVAMSRGAQVAHVSAVVTGLDEVLNRNRARPQGLFLHK
jgi:hypothetical protein